MGANFEKNIKQITQTYDQVYFCTNHKSSFLGLYALKPFNPKLVLLTRLKKTKKSDIKRIQALQPIGILFND